jgi:hypothetical protein
MISFNFKESPPSPPLSLCQSTDINQYSATPSVIFRPSPELKTGYSAAGRQKP